MLRTYTGSCHCGAFRYEADVDLDKGTNKCNCSYCFKTRLRGYLEVLGGEYVTINHACLDDLEPSELASARVTYMNGRDNDWFSPPRETRHL